MEFLLGEQNFSEQRCDACKEYGQECCIYSKHAQVTFATVSCARCRFEARGCSFNARKKLERWWKLVV